MAQTPTSTVPDRRRIRFAPNGGPRPTAQHRASGRRGVRASREVLAGLAAERVVDGPRGQLRPLELQMVEDARRGIAAARDALAQAKIGDSQSAKLVLDDAA